MTDRPILFSAPMIRALLAGTKTQTRRLIPQKTQEAYWEYDEWCSNVSAGVPTYRTWEREFYLERSRYAGGDRLWCKETWGYDWYDDGQSRAHKRVVYRADPGAQPMDNGDPVGWRPSIFMPRSASRITLIVTGVKVERLQEISEEDAWAEGVCTWCEGLDKVPWTGLSIDDRRGLVRSTYGSAVNAYRHLWEHINGPDSWSENPWVSATAFDVHKQNIDTLKEAA
jgi:hypothetical protein